MERMAYLSASDAVLSRCTEMQQKSDQCLLALTADASRSSEDAARIKQVIRRAMKSYRARQANFFQALAQGVFDARTFSSLQAQGEYLRNYADELTDTLLREGQAHLSGAWPAARAAQHDAHPDDRTVCAWYDRWHDPAGL